MRFALATRSLLLLVGTSSFGCSDGDGGSQLPADGGGAPSGFDESNCPVTTTLTLADSKAYFPLNVGGRWAYRGSSNDSFSLRSYLNLVVAQRAMEIRGATSVVLSESHPDGRRESRERYRRVDDTGVVDEGDTGIRERPLKVSVPSQFVTFPLQVCSSHLAYDVMESDVGWDGDADGENESGRHRARVTVRSIEAVTTPVGRFVEALRVETTLRTDIRSSQSGDSSWQLVITEWYAKNLGLVKRIVELPSILATTEELIGVQLDGAARGIVPLESVATGISIGSSSFDEPGRPAVATDGNGFLAVVGRKEDLEAVVLDKTGAVQRRVQLAAGQLLGPQHPALAWGGSSYLVTFLTQAGLSGQRLSSDGELLGPSFTIPPGGRSTGGLAPAIAFGGGHFLVLYGVLTGFDVSLFAARISPEGTIADDQLVAGGAGLRLAPAMAFGENTFLAVWESGARVLEEDADLHAARLGLNGAPLDSTPLVLSSAPGRQTDPDVAFTGSNFFVTWFEERDRHHVGDGNIRAARVTTAGTLLDGEAASGGLRINTNRWSKSRPAVIPFKGDLLVSWESGQYSPDPVGILGTRVSSEGALLDGSSDSDGAWLSGPPSLDSTLFRFPRMASQGDRALLIYIDNTVLKSLGGAILAPW